MTEIRDNLTTVNRTVGMLEKPSWIVVHNTANGTSAEGTAYNNTAYFKNVYRAASAHYFVDDGPVIWRCVDDADAAWHCGEAASRNGAYNWNAIGIEVCEPYDGEFTAAEKENLRWLVTKLMDRYGIDKAHICRHNDVTGKGCPWFYAQDGKAWEELRDYIAGDSERHDESEVLNMQALFQPNDEGCMIWYDGNNLHTLDHPDEMKAVQDFYKKMTGKEIPVFKFGSADAPWASRFCDAVRHGAPNYTME